MGGNKLKKKILKIFVCSLILLIGIGAVNALDINSTNDFTSIDQNIEVSVSFDEGDVLAVENDDVDVVSVSFDEGDVLAVENEEVSVVSASDDNGDILLVSSQDDEKLSSYLWGYSPADDFTQSTTQYKTFYLGKLKILKKYKRFVNGYKPSKKNKKAWKKYKAYKRHYKKAVRKFVKQGRKTVRNARNNHWHFYEYDVTYKIRYVGKYMVTSYYCPAYRQYNYNPLLNKEWWD